MNSGANGYSNGFKSIPFSEKYRLILEKDVEIIKDLFHGEDGAEIMEQLGINENQVQVLVRTISYMLFYNSLPSDFDRRMTPLLDRLEASFRVYERSNQEYSVMFNTSVMDLDENDRALSLRKYLTK